MPMLSEHRLAEDHANAASIERDRKSDTNLKAKAWNDACYDRTIDRRIGFVNRGGWPAFYITVDGDQEYGTIAQLNARLAEVDAR